MFTNLLDFLDTKADKFVRKTVFESNANTYMDNNLYWKSDPLDITYRINHPETMTKAVLEQILDFMRIDHDFLIPEGW